MASRNAGGDTQTPMMRQFHAAKKAHPDCLLFFRMGDFYELFHDDAKVASRVLGIALTARSKGDGAIPMAGVPVKAYEQYLFKLIRRGYKVAICDQMEDPRLAKGIVDRAVTRIVSAGTLTEEELLDQSRNNYLLAVAPARSRLGLAWIDLSTALFRVSECPHRALPDELGRLEPSEVLIPETVRGEASNLYGTIRSVTQATVTPVTDFAFERTASLDLLTDHFKVSTLAGFGVDEEGPGVRAAGAALHYLKETQRGEIDQIRALARYEPEAFLALDRSSRRSLELTANMRDGKSDETLLSCLDRTVTAMGGRLLRERILLPSADLAEIRNRLDAVDELVSRQDLRAGIEDSLKRIFDIERITTKILTRRASARDLANLRESVKALPDLAVLLDGAESARIRDCRARMPRLDGLAELLDRALVDQPPATLKDGGVIREGYHAELDELRAIRSEGKGFIDRFQAREAERTNIANLKVGYNKVFGFYIEVTNANRDLIPEDYIRKQTLKNAERYITPELKEYEVKVLTSDERAKDLEVRIFEALREEAAKAADALQEVALAVAETDVLRSLAETAGHGGYVRPVVDDEPRTRIREGRHPVLETLPDMEAFVPNDTLLDEEGRLVVLTGPNMAGKSTYLRQIALITLMAQMGSFVPAAEAEIGRVDRIFTRVGASDDLARGASTFMVEMVETANILNNATRRSLILLDEVGRGTSTFDGLSLAWALSEYIHRKIKARTLFATHYHQLVRLAEEMEGVKNLSTAAREWKGEIVFLRKIVEGGTDRSYGIHVARLAGVPDPVLTRAGEILREIESLSPDIGRCAAERMAPERIPPQNRQGTLFPGIDDRLRAELEKVDIENTTPLQALLKLKELIELLG